MIRRYIIWRNNHAAQWCGEVHDHASQVWIDISRDDGMLKITVTDDGEGTGLRGVERRLAAFDGVLAVSSPPGGPTVVTLRIPCTFPGQMSRESASHSRS